MNPNDKLTKKILPKNNVPCVLHVYLLWMNKFFLIKDICSKYQRQKQSIYDYMTLNQWSQKHCWWLINASTLERNQKVFHCSLTLVKKQKIINLIAGVRFDNLVHWPLHIEEIH